MSHPTIVPEALRVFQRSLHGKLIVPGDPQYENARKIWNGRINKYPALIVRCETDTDVSNAIQFARRHELTVAVRGGGHNVAGKAACDNGLLIDLTAMKGVAVDPSTRTVLAQAGLTLAELIRETRKYGLATTTGTVSDTGLAGLTLGGGMGWLMGKYGLAIDNLLSVNIITADGQMVHASPAEHPDLFWGVRGGGGNFGVVTTFEFQLHPVKEVLAGTFLYPISRTREVLRFYSEYSKNSPDELTVYAAFVSTPDGVPVVGMILCYCGSLTQGEALIKPVLNFGKPLLAQVGPMDYLDVISMLDAGLPTGRNYYEKGISLAELSDDLIEILAEYGSARTSPFTQIIFQHVHGAAARVGATETAFALRKDHYSLAIVSAWEDEQASRHIDWAHSFVAALEPLAMQGVYVNTLAEGEEERIRPSYGCNYERLVALKNKYDPTNFFRLNANIPPDGAS